MTITASEFTDFVAETSKSGCHHCGSDDASVLGTGEDDDAAVFVLQPTQVSGNFLCYGIVCTVCGHIDMFLATTVERWVTKNRKAKK